MTTKAEWLALAERCEKATVTDREIDATLLAYVEGWSDNDLAYCLRDINRTANVPPFTTSLDAITALIERELPEIQWLCRPDKEGGFANLYRTGGAIMSWPCYAATPALALCAAFCLAMSEKAA